MFEECLNFFRGQNSSESSASVCLSHQLYETANKYHFYHSLALLGAAHSGKPVVVSMKPEDTSESL